MRKPATRLIALALCILLLVACAPAEDIPEPTPTPEVTAAPTPELNPTTSDRHSEAVERARWILDVHENFDDYFYAYQKDHPNAVYWWYDRVQKDGTFQVHCGGPDIAAVDASGYLPNIIILDYNPHQPDARLDEDIPREPVTDYEFIDGVTVSMKQAVYPTATESVEVVFSNGRDIKIPYDVDYTLYKYIDGEWQHIPRPNSVGTGHNIPANTELSEIYHFPYPLGKGLYRITPGTMGRYDFEKFSLDHTIEFIVSEQ